LTVLLILSLAAAQRPEVLLPLGAVPRTLEAEPVGRGAVSSGPPDTAWFPGMSVVLPEAGFCPSSYAVSSHFFALPSARPPLGLVRGC